MRAAAAWLAAGAISRLPHGLKWRASGLLKAIAARLTVDASFQVSRQGITWRLNPFDEVQRDLFWFGEVETGDCSLIDALVAPGAVVLDVGANFGHHAIRLARRGCLVHAFEPNPSTYARLEEHLVVNGIASVRTYALGLGARRERPILVVDDRNTGAAHVGSDMAGDRRVEVEIAPLDEIAVERGIGRVDFAKVDVEGYEPFFVAGAEKTLRRWLPPLMIEVAPDNLARHGNTAGSLLELLRGVGYREFFVRSPGRLEPFGERSFEGGWNHRNVFCFGDRPAHFPFGLIDAQGSG
jgi:FkbM family methyltransferase